MVVPFCLALYGINSEGRRKNDNGCQSNVSVLQENKGQMATRNHGEKEGERRDLGRETNECKLLRGMLEKEGAEETGRMSKDGQKV